MCACLLENAGNTFFRTGGADYPVTLHHVPDEWNPEPCCCGILKIQRRSRPAIMDVNAALLKKSTV